MVARACGDETSHTRNNLNGRSLGQFIKVTLCHLSAFSIPRFAIFAFFGCPFGGISRLDFEIRWSFPFHIPSAFYHSVYDSTGSAHGTSAFPSITSIFLHSFRSVFDSNSHFPFLSRSIRDAFHPPSFSIYPFQTTWAVLYGLGDYLGRTRNLSLGRSLVLPCFPDASYTQNYGLEFGV